MGTMPSEMEVAPYNKLFIYTAYIAFTACNAYNAFSVFTASTANTVYIAFNVSLLDPCWRVSESLFNMVNIVNIVKIVVNIVVKIPGNIVDKMLSRLSKLHHLAHLLCQKNSRQRQRR